MGVLFAIIIRANAFVFFFLFRSVGQYVHRSVGQSVALLKFSLKIYLNGIIATAHPHATDAIGHAFVTGALIGFIFCAKLLYSLSKPQIKQ